MFMAAVLEKESTIYRKGQTTVPLEVRNALGVGPGDTVKFRVESDGTVLVRKAEEDEDPVVGAFLAFLESDLQRRPQAVQPITIGLEDRLRGLTADIAIDRKNDRIVGDVGL
jgi:antitoxin PrlF